MKNLLHLVTIILNAILLISALVLFGQYDMREFYRDPGRLILWIFFIGAPASALLYVFRRPRGASPNRRPRKGLP
jgi:hypothetical protein